MFKDHWPRLIKARLLPKVLAHIASDCVNILHPSLAKRAIFNPSTLLRPNLSSSFGLHNISQLTRWTFCFKSNSPQTHLLTYLSNSLCMLAGSFCGNSPMVLITNLASVKRPDLDTLLVFQPSSLLLTLFMSFLFDMLL